MSFSSHETGKTPLVKQSIKQHRNQRQPQQDLLQLNIPIVPLRLEKRPLNERKEKQRPEQQLHMLPCGLVDPRKWRDQNILPCPIVQKVQNRAAKSSRRKTGCLPKNWPLLHCPHLDTLIQIVYSGNTCIYTKYEPWKNDSHQFYVANGCSICYNIWKARGVCYKMEHQSKLLRKIQSFSNV